MTGTGSILEIRWFPWNTSVKERGSRQLLNDPSCDYYDQLYDQSFENEDLTEWYWRHPDNIWRV